MDRKNSFSFLTAAYNPRKKSTRGDLSTLKVMGRAVSMEDVAEFWGHIVNYKTSTCRNGKGKEAQTV